MTLEEFNRKYGDTFYYCREEGYLQITIERAKEFVDIVEAAKRCCQPSNLTADTARRWEIERDLEYLKTALENLEK